MNRDKMKKEVAPETGKRRNGRVLCSRAPLRIRIGEKNWEEVMQELTLYSDSIIWITETNPITWMFLLRRRRTNSGSLLEGRRQLNRERMRSCMVDLPMCTESIRREILVWWLMVLTGGIYNKHTLRVVKQRASHKSRVQLKIINTEIFRAGFCHLRTQMLGRLSTLLRRGTKLPLDLKQIGPLRQQLLKSLIRVANKTHMLRRKSNWILKFLTYQITLNINL